MADSTRIAQAIPLEVPVTVQSWRTADGTDHREPVTQTATTTLVFDNGAVLHLKSRVSPGDSVFLRNEKTGREMLCKVLEAPAEGQPGYTDLEFNNPDPEFWAGCDAPAQTPEQNSEAPQADLQPSNEQLSKVQLPNEQQVEVQQIEDQQVPAEIEKPTGNSAIVPGADAGAPSLIDARSKEFLSTFSDSAPESLRANPPKEVLVPAHEMAERAPAEASDAPQAPLASPLKEVLVPAHETTAPALTPTEDFHATVDRAETEADDAKFEEQLAALLALETKRAPKRQASAKDAEPDKPKAVSEELHAEGDGSPGPTIKGRVFSTLAFRIHGLRNLTTGKSAVVVGTIASVLIAVALGVIWHAVQGVSVREVYQGLADSIHSKREPPSSAAQPSRAPATPSVANKPLNPETQTQAGNSGAASSAPPAQNIPQQSVAPKAAIPGAKNSAAATAGVTAARTGKSVAKSALPAAPRAEPSENPATSDQADLAPSNHRQTGEPHSPRITPASIVAQLQPPTPQFAKSMDLDRQVTLDAVIDEKGNIVESKQLTGSRLLKSAAQNAVALWVFEPAQSNGKRVASHLVLTVEFQ
jgi:Gram-negative bacterial TonB protein C-terminal